MTLIGAALIVVGLLAVSSVVRLWWLRWRAR
jgi:hypothetical protein